MSGYGDTENKTTMAHDIVANKFYYSMWFYVFSKINLEYDVSSVQSLLLTYCTI